LKLPFYLPAENSEHRATGKRQQNLALSRVRLRLHACTSTRSIISKLLVVFFPSFFLISATDRQ